MKQKQRKRMLSVLLSAVMLLSLTVLPAKAADAKTNIKIGDYIRLGTYNNESVLWRCVAVDDNGPLMLSDRVLEDYIAYDARTGANAQTGSHRRNSWRSKYGSNHWRDSNMRSWLNSGAEAGKVDWLCGNPPDADHVSSGTAYDRKAGFLSSFRSEEIGAIKTVTQRSIVSHPEYTAGYIDEPGIDLPYNTDIDTVADGYESAYYENITDKVFLLDVKQLNTVKQNLGSYYIGKNKAGQSWNYWLRTPVTDCNHDMRYVTTGGIILRDAPYKEYYGARPAFYLDAEYYTVSQGKGTESEPYAGTVQNKPQEILGISGAERDTGDGNWDVDTDQYLQVELSELYSTDRAYANPTIPVYVIQKPRSDKENMVILYLAEGYSKSQQKQFVEDARRLWGEVLKTEPYRSMADRFNVYALCTASVDGYGGSSTFFAASKTGISVNKGQWRNHVLERIIGPAFIEKIHDAHIQNKTKPNEYSMNDEYSQYYYVYEYINQFVILTNSGEYFGGSHDNMKRGIHYILASTGSNLSPFTQRHELGHGLLRLGDEYNTAGQPLSEGTLQTSLNISDTKDPAKVKWKNMLGFRNTYTCPHYDNSYMYNSSHMCIMEDSYNTEFCDVCKLQGIKRMSQLVKNPSDIYVAVPEVKKYSGDYKNPAENHSAFNEANYYGYLKYQNDRNSRLLSGVSKKQFGSEMKGQQIELRTIVQNLSDSEKKKVSLRMWVEHSTGEKATTASGTEVLTAKDFDIPIWSEKPNFWPKNALDYTGSDFDSGLVNCSLVYTIPQDAVLKSGDTVGFEVIDRETGKILADDRTEAQTYANVTIEYKLEDGSDVPNTKPAVFPAAAGTKVDWELPKELNGYILVKSEGTDKPVGAGGLTVTCYYKAKEERPAASFIITDESGAEADKTLKAGKFKAKLTLPEGRKTAAVIIVKYVNGTLGELRMSEPKEASAVIETDFITVTGEDLTKQTEIKAFAFESMGNIKPMYDFQHITNKTTRSAK